MLRVSITAGVLLASTALSSAPAFAQSAAQAANAAASAKSANTIAEVIVTAEKREERLKDVPISIVAVSGDQLIREGITDSRDLNLLAPGLNFQVNGAFAQPTIRGVGTSLTSSEANVATYIDGVYQGNQIGNLLNLANVSSVQVLKGPQGTLFGRNATGGAILVTTRDPSSTADGSFIASYGRFGESKVDGYISGPIMGDWLSASLAVNHLEDDGYVHNVFLNLEQAKVHDESARAKIALQPTSDLKFVLTAATDHRYDTTGVTQRPLHGNNANRRANPTILVPDDPYTIATNWASQQALNDQSINLRTLYSPSWGTITEISSWRKLKLNVHSDGDLTSVFGSETFLKKGSESVSHELNYASPSGHRLTWVGGLYFYSDLAPTNIVVGVGPAITKVLAADAVTKTRAKAVYGEAYFDVSDSLRLTAGLRYSDETKSFIKRTAPASAGQVTFKSWTPRLAARYALDSESNVYATYSRGFKSGEFNLIAATFQSVAPEKVDAYELGYKHASRNMTFNAAAFYYDYKNIQAQSFDPATILILLHDAAAEIYGVDADASIAVGEEWRFSAGAAYTHSEFTNYAGAQFFYPITTSATATPPYPAGTVPCPATVPVCGNYQIIGSGAGRKLPRSPEFTGNVSANYRHALTVGAIEANVNVAYNSGFFWTQDNRVKQDAYTLVNGRISWSPRADDRLKLSLWGRNLTDVAYEIYGNEAASGDNVAYGRPRTVGVEIGYKF
jgi:iron complex outermembrane receptor protein